MTPEDEGYFARLENGLDDAMAVAREARAQGRDPTTDVEIPIARDMADRVEKVLGIDGVAERVRELEGEYSREEAALELVTDFVEGTVGDYEGRAGKIEGAVRTAVALLTEGVVAAPIEGIDRVELLENDDGSEFINVYYAGPIRSAGGTAQALSVLVADYARSLLGIEEYRAREAEIERYAEEVDLYDRETGLQYTPADAETRYIARHMPIMLDGEATGDKEVSGYRDLDRVDTNAARGGMCLVLAEGMALKAPKIQRYTRALDEVSWPWLDDLIEGTVKGSSDVGDDEAEDRSEDADDTDDSVANAGENPGDRKDGDDRIGPPRVEPSGKYLRDLIAGRPVFGHPSEPGGFRLRYGRARNHGFATAGVHPATMRLVDDFLAAGTQLKTERPGKAAGVVPVDSIEGPTVRLANGDVRRIDDPAEAKEVANGVEAVLDLGEYLVNFGEFVENNHPLAPASYAPEWWRREFEATDADVQALADDPHVDLDSPTPEEALDWAEAYDCPLHPAYTYLWHDVSVDAVADLAAAIANGNVVDGTLVIKRTETTRQALECLLVEHRQREDALRVPVWRPLARSLGIREGLIRDWTLADLPASAREYDGGDNAIRTVNAVAPFEVRERAPTRIGCRMGRPEKSEERELSPAVHSLFPIGEAGGSTRDVSAAADDREHGPRGHVEVTVADRACPDCGGHTYRHACPDCGSHTDPHYECADCGTVTEPDESGRVVCPRCDREVSASTRRTIDLKSAYRGALETVGERESAFEILKGVKGLTSRNSTPEPLEKGVLRAKHGVSAFKDGTVRYDMTDLPVTAVRPAELDVTADRFRELGYETDVAGDPLRHDDQLVELRVQDVVLSDGAAEHLLRTADFVDDLLESMYDLPAFYRIKERADLVGELVFGMAPHTSAATVGRIVGFTSASVGYAHPYFHAAKRRNCFHPDTKVWYEDGDGWRHKRIEALVEERLDSGTIGADDFGTTVRELDDGVAVPSIAPDGTVVRKPVEAVSKHAAPEHMVRIRTGSGRQVTVTPDHEIHVLDGGEFDTKHASAVDPGDSLVTPARLDAVEPAAEPPSFDLLAEFLRTDTVDNDRLAVREIGRERLYDLFEAALADKLDSEFYPLTSTAEHLGVSEKRLSNYVHRDSIPAGLLADLFDSRAALLAAVPDDVRLGITRDSTGIVRHVRLNERVSTLLGYYAAEGFARERERPKGSIHQTTVCGTEREARAFVLDTLREELGIQQYRENGAKITAPGQLLRVFVDTVLDAGSHAHTKRVPQPFFDAPDRTVAAYLRGYFSGDGSVDGTQVSATTVSPELREDVVALLTRLGIESRVRHGDPRPLAEQFPAFDGEDAGASRPVYTVSITGEASARFADEVGFHLSRKDDRLRGTVATAELRGDQARCFDGGSGDCLIETVDRTEIVESDADAVYCVTVADTHTLVTNDLSNGQCDGDEDCVMLLMDGLLNFSKSFLPDQRGGSMDAPLVMSSRIDPTEIDDEAHNMDVVADYPRELYEASRRLADPGEVDVTLAGDSVGTDGEYSGFDHTHDVTDIAMGPDLSAYKTLGDMETKMDAQLELARTLRAVDETDVAERVIEYHFLPDLIGNLRAFASQETRCLDCGESYRRPPLTGDCRECGGDVTLTVYRGSVTKYIDTAVEVAERFGCREYTKQRLKILERSLESIFEDDTNKQSGIADFM